MSTAYDPLATDEMSDPLPKAAVKQENMFQRYARMVYNFFGFKKWYNFIFWFIFGGALFFFCWYNIKSIDVRGYWLKHTSPSQYIYFRLPRYSIGMQMHLGCCLPAGILAPLQFVPIIRHKVLLFHRINGWLVTLLLVVSNAGALMIVNRSLGGHFDLQVFGGILAIFTTVSAFLGVVNIKLKQLDQHRKWMMRCWVYMASIMSLRFVQMATAQVVSNLRGFYVHTPCEVLEFLGSNMSYYSQCAAGGERAVVEANLYTQRGPEEVIAAYELAFGQAGLIAFVIHAVLVEVYIHLTPAESERLRNVSYERQLERGYKKPGSGGLTSDRLGDAPRWRPSNAVEK